VSDRQRRPRPVVKTAITIRHDSERWPDGVVDECWQIELADGKRTQIIGYSTYELEAALGQALTWMYCELKRKR
jgi:hypothetical protein